MSHVNHKPDLLDTLTRRKRTVANFLKTKGIKNYQELETLILELEKEYFISGEFYHLCSKIFPVPVVPVLPPRLSVEKIVSIEKVDEVLELDEKKEVLKKTSKKHSKKE